MTVDELVATIDAAPREAVPALLARNLAFVLAHAPELHTRLLHRDPHHGDDVRNSVAPTHPAGVAVYWLEACTVPRDGLWEGPRDAPTLTPFGVVLLERIGLAGAAEPDFVTLLPPDATPADAQLLRLAEAITRKRNNPLGSEMLLLLGRMTRTAFALAPADRVAGREATGCHRGRARGSAPRRALAV